MKKRLGLKNLILKKNEKGLSNIITNILLILLVLITIGTVWLVIRDTLSQRTGDIELGQFTFDLRIKSAYVSGTNIIVSVKRNPGGENFLGIKFIFLNETKTITVERRLNLGELEEMTFTFTASEIPGIKEGDRVSIAPIYGSSGNEKTGSITDSVTISGNPPPGGGPSGTGEEGTGYCGDQIIQIPNGLGVSEQCDGGNLGGQSCESLGFIGGTLSCTLSCQFDTTQCIGEIPPSCDGIWQGDSEDPGVECDGTPLPRGCSSRCECERGYTMNGVGGCTLNPPLNTGIIFSTWPQGSPKHFDSLDLPRDNLIMQSYIGDYVNFTNSPELGCFQITFAEYLVGNNRSYLRIENPADISSNQGYLIWEAVNCGQ